MPETVNASVIEKIKKLFAMANRGKNNDGSGNEAEAAAAMAKAQDLLTKYNLDIRTVQDSVKESRTGAVEGKREQVKINRSAMYRWQQDFWKSIAEANYCFHWVTEITEEHPRRKGYWRKVKRHVILGSEVNVTVVQMMGEYLTQLMEDILPYPNAERLSRSALSWREGCAERLVERIRAKVAQAQKEGITVDNITCTALAVRDVAQSEYAANYDAKYGKGAWARHLAWEAEWNSKQAEREAEYEKQRKQDAIALAKETPAQKAKREAKERREQERWERKYERQQQREIERRDHSAYYAGRRKANDINLDSQIKGEAL